MANSSLEMKQSASLWVSQGVAGLLWAFLLCSIVWGGALLVKKRLRPFLFEFLGSDKKRDNQMEVLGFISLTPKLRAYHLEVNDRQYLIVDNSNSVSVTPLCEKMESNGSTGELEGESVVVKASD